jgi:NAD(P)-dependent dehydrogenase (short-subunit alcohol dehydrogenase family)
MMIINVLWDGHCLRRMRDSIATKVVMITGAAGGQGRVAVEKFASAGARLVLVDVDGEGLEETVSLAADAEAVTVQADLTTAAGLDAIVDRTREAFGHLDVLYNNAGVVSGGSLESYTEAEWDRVFAVNVKSQFFLVQRALPLLRESEAASILNISSLAGLAGVAGACVYGASKGAVVALTKNLAVELAGDGIRVNCIASGTLDTPLPRAYAAQFPEEQRAAVEKAWVDRQLFKRLGEPGEVVDAALFLCSSSASFITGTILNVDGGWLAW